MKHILFYILIILSILQIQVLTTGCANIVPPAGGARDSLAPQLIRSSPPNGTRNFSEKVINLTFDEYVDLDNPSQNMVISPVPKIPITPTRKLNVVTLRIKDTLEDNTTYSFNFRSAIKDVNEGNVAKDFTYIFSTGAYIDSMQIAGKVILAESGGYDTTLTILLHRNDADSALKKEKPRYITKIDNKGHFVFKNLPANQTYHIYALEDNGSLLYLDSTKLFAFSDTTVTTGAQTDSVTLYAYANPKIEKATNAAAANTKGEKRLRLQTSLKSSKQDLLETFSLQFGTPLKTFDSTKIHISTDTLFTLLTNYSWQLDSTRKTATFFTNWKENTLYNFILEKDFATDTLGQQLLKADTLSFTTMRNDEYGKVVLRFRNLDLSKNPVIQFVQNDKVIASYPLTGEQFTRPLFLPGEYNLRLLYDDNKNGKWDPGKFYGEHKQPELVKPIERKLNIRPNWSDEIEIPL